MLNLPLLHGSLMGHVNETSFSFRKIHLDFKLSFCYLTGSFFYFTKMCVLKYKSIRADHQAQLDPIRSGMQ